MSATIILWLLFALPALVIGSMYLGASLYHAGAQGRAPTVRIPTFGLSGVAAALKNRLNGHEMPKPDKLPEV